MKRVLLTALSVVLFASVASAQNTGGTIWLEAPGGGDTVNVLVSETAVIQLWMDWTSTDSARYHQYGMNAEIEHRSTNGQRFEVVGFNNSPALPTGLNDTFFRKSRGLLDDGPGHDGIPDVTGKGNLSLYQFQGDVTPLGTGGFDETQGLDGTEGAILLDEIIIHGTTDSGSTMDRVIFNATRPPSYFEGDLYGDNFIAPGEAAEKFFSLGTGINKKNALFVHVSVPEPGSLALLAFGGLAAIRRRR
jgi:hypothetical protein